MALSSRIGRSPVLRLSMLLACILPLAGCWIVNQEVFQVGEGEILPLNLSTSFTMEKSGDHLSLSRSGYGNDYSFQERKPNGAMDTDDDSCTSGAGTLRAVHLQGAVYAVQIHCGSDSTYDIAFYEISANSWHDVVPDLSDDRGRAARYGLAINDSDVLSGDPTRINQFVRSLANVSFVRQPG